MALDDKDKRVLDEIARDLSETGMRPEFQAAIDAFVTGLRLRHTDVPDDDLAKILMDHAVFISRMVVGVPITSWMDVMSNLVLMLSKAAADLTEITRADL
jgi:hypothetical protein